jgi:hypothetical protein
LIEDRPFGKVTLTHLPAGLLHVVGLDDEVHPRAVAEPEEALHDALGVKFGQDARLLGPVGLELVEVRDGFPSRAGT